MFRDAIDLAPCRVWRVLESPAPTSTARATDLWQLFKAGREFRKLGTRGGHQLLRWLPMPIADFAARCSRMICCAPRLPGPACRARCSVRDRRAYARDAPARVPSTSVAAATHAGARRSRTSHAGDGGGGSRRGGRDPTGAHVERIIVRDERVAGVVVSGHELPATTVLSCVDPKTTFPELYSTRWT